MYLQYLKSIPEINMADAFVRATKISQWGNSAALRIGQSVLEAAHLQVGDPVEIIAREFEIIVRRKQPRVTMAELLEKFDPEKHRHDLAFDTDPTGTETK
jgi:antitoxin component of MazEF toxin-antitoxin module